MAKLYIIYTINTNKNAPQNAERFLGAENLIVILHEPLRITSFDCRYLTVERPTCNRFSEEKML